MDLNCPNRLYEIRVIVHSVVDMQGRGHEMYPDVYVDVTLGKSSQLTDIHFGVIDGSALFNYRTVFPLTSREAVSPLEIAVKDFDFFTADDLLGRLALDLEAVPAPSSRPQHCTLAMLDSSPTTNMFLTEDGICQLSGFWPVWRRKLLRRNERAMIAKIHLTL